MVPVTRSVGVLLVALLTCSTALSPALAQADPREGPGTSTLRLGFAADAQEAGQRPHLRAALEHLRTQQAEWLLYGGDTNYGYEDAPKDYVDALGWYGENDRVLFVYGNHDDDGDGHRALHPGNATWWTWSEDGFTVVGLDTNRPLHEGSPQWAWLRETLEAHRDNFVVVIMHISWWAPNAYHSPKYDFPGNASAAEALARETDVELLLGAHEHYYARWPQGGEGPDRVVTGPVEAHVRQVPPAVQEEAAAWSAERTWMMLEVDADEVRLQTFHRDGRVLDAFAVERDLPPAPPAAPVDASPSESASGEGSPRTDAPDGGSAAPGEGAMDEAQPPCVMGPCLPGAPGPDAADAETGESSPPDAEGGAPPAWLLVAGAAPLLLGLMLHQRRSSVAADRARDWLKRVPGVRHAASRGRRSLAGFPRPGLGPGERERP